jgi:hypothetical protein
MRKNGLASTFDLIFGFLCERGGVEVDAEILTPSRNRKMQVKGPYYYQTVPGLLDKKEVRRRHLLLIKRWPVLAARMASTSPAYSRDESRAPGSNPSAFSSDITAFNLA